jgi:hypothetical protein
MWTTAGKANFWFIPSTGWMFCTLLIAIIIIDFAVSVASRSCGELIARIQWLEKTGRDKG